MSCIEVVDCGHIVTYGHSMGTGRAQIVYMRSEKTIIAWQ